MTKKYVLSSWRNVFQQDVIELDRQSESYE